MDNVRGNIKLRTGDDISGDAWNTILRDASDNIRIKVNDTASFAIRIPLQNIEEVMRMSLMLDFNG